MEKGISNLHLHLNLTGPYPRSPGLVVLYKCCFMNTCDRPCIPCFFFGVGGEGRGFTRTRKRPDRPHPGSQLRRRGLWAQRRRRRRRSRCRRRLGRFRRRWLWDCCFLRCRCRMCSVLHRRTVCDFVSERTKEDTLVYKEKRVGKSLL